ncbi:hypothetical protein FOL46_009628 [Perkinsus olseni]|nr:hypothetical protein FOL46_009628 [Perkinsus olseni]
MAASSSTAAVDDSVRVPLTVANGGTAAESSPRIKYAVVARDKTVLCEYAFVGGNFTSVARVLLAKISPMASGVSGEVRKSYVYDG